MNIRGRIYLWLGWTLTIIDILVFSLRVYSRAILTRSIGSDDFLIAFSVILTIVGNAGITLHVKNGFGVHQSELTVGQFAEAQKWAQILWLTAFLSFFFLRASIMLFVLRLLPIYKRWQKHTILICFGVNIAITLISCISYGLSCVPFRAWYENVPGSTCFSKHKLVITNQVNAILACLIDITTALIPQVLLWKVQMKRSTKLSLNVIFSLGLVVAALSIGRAAEISDRNMETDTSYRLAPSSLFSLVEDKVGIIIASAPALRQFFAYVQRTGTVMPSKYRQYANEDFVRMRWRINIRDIFWYRSPHPISGRILDAQPIFRQKAPEDIEATAHKSLLGEWRRKVSNAVFSSINSNSEPDVAHGPQELSMQKPSRGTTSSHYGNQNIDAKFSKWQRDQEARHLGQGSSNEGSGIPSDGIVDPSRAHEVGEGAATLSNVTGVPTMERPSNVPCADVIVSSRTRLSELPALPRGGHVPK